LSVSEQAPQARKLCELLPTSPQAPVAATPIANTHIHMWTN